LRAGCIAAQGVIAEARSFAILPKAHASAVSWSQAVTKLRCVCWRCISTRRRWRVSLTLIVLRVILCAI